MDRRGKIAGGGALAAVVLIGAALGLWLGGSFDSSSPTTNTYVITFKQHGKTETQLYASTLPACTYGGMPPCIGSISVPTTTG